ncbi:MAG: hypothetical protein ACK5HM_07570, partial [Gemmatimonas sp.]
MKTFRISSRLLAGVLVAACVAPATDTPSTTSTGAAEPRAMQVVGIWRSGLDTLALRTAQLDSAAARLAEPDGVERARNAFVAARRAFKLVELGLEYYTPSTARNMNGPALPEVEETEGPEAVFPPTGFQVIEEILYGEDPVGDAERLTQETATLRQLVTRASTMMAAQQSTDDHVRDAAKLEVARIVTLGITGFDSPVAGHSLAEADAALEGLVRTLAPYRSEAGNWTRFDTLVSAARGVLTAGASRETFDHFAFIVDHANPLARALRDTRAALGIETPTE